MLRFGAMLIEVDSCLTRETAHVGQRNQHTGETLKSWLSEHCPEVNYKTAMRFKALAQDMRDYCQVPSKLPLTLALPGADGSLQLDGLPPKVNRDRAEKLQRQIWDMVQGSSARQLMFTFKGEDKPLGGYHAPKLLLETFARENGMDSADYDAWAKPTQQAFRRWRSLREREQVTPEQQVAAARADIADRLALALRAIEMCEPDDIALLDEPDRRSAVARLEHMAGLIKKTYTTTNAALAARK
jgi:hypothetical protein